MQWQYALQFFNPSLQQNFGERKKVWKLCTELGEIAKLESFLEDSIPFCGHTWLRQKLMLMKPERMEDAVLKQR
jgi:hypothetical protein